MFHCRIPTTTHLEVGLARGRRAELVVHALTLATDTFASAIADALVQTHSITITTNSHGFTERERDEKRFY